MAKKQAEQKVKKTKKQVNPTEPKMIETPKVKSERPYIPDSLQGHELFFVKEGSYYNHSHHKIRIDANGCLTGQHLLMYSVSAVWRAEISAGDLVDVTEKFANASAAVKLRNEGKTNEDKDKARAKAVAESTAKQKVIAENEAKKVAEKAVEDQKIIDARVAAAQKTIKDQKDASAAAVLKANAEQKALEAAADKEAAAAVKTSKKKAQ